MGVDRDGLFPITRPGQLAYGLNRVNGPESRDNITTKRKKIRSWEIKSLDTNNLILVYVQAVNGK